MLGRLLSSAPDRSLSPPLHCSHPPSTQDSTRPPPPRCYAWAILLATVRSLSSRSLLAWNAASRHACIPVLPCQLTSDLKIIIAGKKRPTSYVPQGSGASRKTPFDNVGNLLPLVKPQRGIGSGWLSFPALQRERTQSHRWCRTTRGVVSRIWGMLSRLWEGWGCCKRP